MSEFLREFVADFASAMKSVDERRPIAVRRAEKGVFQPGIGPHGEDDVVRMCIKEMSARVPDSYGTHACGVAYPGSGLKCDLCLGQSPEWSWAIELKLLRFLGDNGKPNGHMLMHILSPYAQDHSALTDCSKLASSCISSHKAIVIFGYHHSDWPLEPAIEAFEVLAARNTKLGMRQTAMAESLVHPIHSSARAFGWELPPK